LAWRLHILKITQFQKKRMSNIVSRECWRWHEQGNWCMCVLVCAFLIVIPLNFPVAFLSSFFIFFF
jgi:hypothetical protein